MSHNKAYKMSIFIPSWSFSLSLPEAEVHSWCCSLLDGQCLRAPELPKAGQRSKPHHSAGSGEPGTPGVQSFQVRHHI